MEMFQCPCPAPRIHPSIFLEPIFPVTCTARLGLFLVRTVGASWAGLSISADLPPLCCCDVTLEFALPSRVPSSLLCVPQLFCLRFSISCPHSCLFVSLSGLKPSEELRSSVAQAGESSSTLGTRLSSLPHYNTQWILCQFKPSRSQARMH
jgi:hypothetical protein